MLNCYGFLYGRKEDMKQNNSRGANLLLRMKGKTNTDAAVPPKDQPTLVGAARKEKLTTGCYLFLAFFIPFFLMFITFALAKVSPFGGNQILATDLWHQYYPFLTDYHSKLQNGGSLLWTWKSGGGTNYPALMAYYTASPLNLLSVLFPASVLREFVYVTTCVKIGLAGLFFALFLRITFKRRDVTITAFGIMYALCAFIMGYYWNIIWLDTIALVPLVVAGTIALLREGKFRLYVAALALSIIANYYMALFTCIFVVLVSIGYTVVEWKSWRKTLRDFFKMAGCSLVSGAISAALILPAYFALKYTHSSNNKFPETFAVNMGGTHDFAGLLSGLGKTIANSMGFTAPSPKEGLPNVYCGVFVIFLAILFLFCSKIKKRERFYCLGLLLFFMVSFVVRQLDYVWHGFHFPNMLYFRFSFLFSFVAIYMAFRVFSHIDSVKPVSVIAAICGFLVYLGIAYRYYHLGGKSPWITTLSSVFGSDDVSSNPDPVILSGFFGLLIAAWVLLYAFRSSLKRQMQAILSAVIGVASAVFIVVNIDAFTAPLRQNSTADSSTGFTVVVILLLIMVIASIFFALYSKQLNADNRMLKGMLSLIILTLALVEGTYSAASGVKTVGVTDTKWYPLGTTNTLAMVDEIKEREEDTVDLYRSEVTKIYTQNDPTLIGVNGISMFSSMTNRDITGFMEKFGVCGWIECNRYNYQESSPFTNMMLNIKYLISPYSGAHLDTTNLNLIDKKGTTLLMQNKYYLPMGFMVKESLLDYDVSTLSSADPFGNQNLFFQLATGLEGDLYEEFEPTTATGTAATATAPYDGVAVAYCTPHGREAYSVTLRNGTSSVTSNIQRPFIMMLGTVKAGDQLTVSAGSGSLTGRFAMFNEELFVRAHDMFARSTLNASEVGDSTIRGSINAVEDGLFYTSIPAIAGWKVYVDGEEAEITPVGGALIAVKLTKGAHTIEMTYMPEGFIPGIVISVAGILIFITMLILYRKRINLLDRFCARVGITWFEEASPEKAAAHPRRRRSGKAADHPAPVHDDVRDDPPAEMEQEDSPDIFDQEFDEVVTYLSHNMDEE